MLGQSHPGWLKHRVYGELMGERMYECERLFGVDEGMKTQAMVETYTGLPCPCKRNEPCLLLPADPVPIPKAV